MRKWRPLVGRLVLVLVVFASGYLGARLGLLHAPVAQASHNFGDVPDSVFYHDFVDFLVDNGITAGCQLVPPLYCGEDPVTRGQMAVFLKKLFDLVDQKVNAQVAALGVCPLDSVKVGSTCIDKYEASVWETTDAGLIQKIKAGTVTLAELQAGAVQRGVNSDDYGQGCPDTGNGCVNLYAVSIPGVKPSLRLTWFQATAAAKNAGKRLPTNAEWQAAALGTPDGAPCVVNATGPGPTGTAGCVSDAGAFDTVGNLYEWVADWVPGAATACPGWAPIGTFNSDDLMCLAGAATTEAPAALIRGGGFGNGADAGVFAVSGLNTPSGPHTDVGFRAAR
jgi:hypothetical protein